MYFCLPRTRLVSLTATLIAMFTLVAAPAALAQTAVYSGVTTAVVNASTNSNITNPQAVAVDAHGNVFVADGGSSIFAYEVLAGTGGAAPGTVNTKSKCVPIGSGLFYATGIAVDTLGNVYVADNSGYLYEFVAGTNGAAAGVVNQQSQVIILGSGTFSNPAGVAVDSHGNVFVADIF